MRIMGICVQPPPHPAPHLVSFHPRLVNSVADVERLDHCQEAFACAYAQGDGRGDDVQGLDLLNIAGHSGILRHLCPSAFQPDAITKVDTVGELMGALDGKEDIG